MSQEIPEWFDDLCLKATDRRMNLTDAKALWREISKPESAAKIPEVVKLVEKIKEIEDYAQEVMQTNPSERVSLDELWVKQNCEEALAPFKGGE